MQCFWAFVLGIICLRLGAGHAVDRGRQLQVQAAIGDLSHICDGRPDGELVPHPLDCSGYFVCARVPTLHYCDQGLQFDETRGACDLTENTNCRQSELLQASHRPANDFVADSSELIWWPQRPRPVFVAVDVASGLPVSPMAKYDPQHIECRHFGAYFLPHPSNCRLYFICAYGHLHRHQCGRGTFWNYEQSECQLSNSAVCYGQSRPDRQDADGGIDETSGTTTSSGGEVTVCYIVGTSGTSTVFSEPSTTDATVPLLEPVPSPPRAEASSPLTCPSEKQSYMSHPEDCSKYYICIGGLPVLTSCPKGLYWDQMSGYCDLAKNVKCFQV
ncbi:probable chitinase 10 [Drosophila pseudoobscura]|uniref:Probable chitinase 10 n=1 Tax=Drosophila pseudoobscura pseudoobscura TaxID=46245 RepID=A0A6I8UCH7_DROPS|nr:probable chitinase 10 [Drosophila pseudoobscura]XP_033238169.1 probable chitinase 10 [Drosophila pseudoobscura]